METTTASSLLDQKLHNLKVIVFDLDYTLWPFWVDTHVSPPFRNDNNGKVLDSCGQHVKHYPEAPEILKKLKELGYTIAVASRTSAISEARDLLKLFGWLHYFSHFEIYPGKKTTHMRKISESSGVPFSQILFFDDEYRNIEDLTRAGVCSIQVNNGIRFKDIHQGLSKFTSFHNK